MRYKVILWRRHVSGLPEVGIQTSEGIPFYILPETTKVMELYGCKEIDDKQLVFIRKQKEKLKGTFGLDTCGVPGCNQEMNGTDRHIPLCEDHWDEQELIDEKDIKKYWKWDGKTKYDKKSILEVIFR